MQAKKTFLQLEWIVAILITAAACFIHFYLWLHVGGLWRDEVNLLSISERHTFFDMERDSFPIIMPLVIHFWMASGLGDSDLRLRVIGLMVGLGVLAALWIAGWKTRRAPPLLGLALLGLNDTFILFGDSLRAYGLGSLLAVALTASAFVFVQKPSGRRAAWLLLFAVLSVQVLYHNAVLVAAVSFGAWTVCWRRKDNRAALQILLVAVVAAASLLPYLRNFQNNVDASTVIRTGVTLPRLFSIYHDALGYPFSWFIYLWALLAAIVIIRALAGFWQNFKTPAKPGSSMEADLSLFAAMFLIVATIGFPVFFWRAQLPMHSWYVLPFMASVVVCLDAALPVFTGLRRVVVFGLVTGTALVSVFVMGANLNRHFSNMNLFAQTLTTDAAPQDFIIVYPWNYGVTFNHYFKAATPWNTLPPLSDHSVHHFDLLKLQMQDTNALAPVFQQISQALQSGHRVWILTTMHGMETPPPGTPALESLPPPPLESFGWSEGPYDVVWASQVSHFIADHSTEYGQVQSPFTGIYLTENMELLAARGWRTNSPAP